jgi:hypothetical protein
MYLGRLPWSDKTCAQMIHCVAILNERPPLPEDMPGPLVDVLRSCWDRVPERRPSFKDLKERFRSICLTEPLQPHTSSSRPKAGRTEAIASASDTSAAAAGRGDPAGAAHAPCVWGLRERCCCVSWGVLRGSGCTVLEWNVSIVCASSMQQQQVFICSFIT